jgi:hypothetical protein
MPSKKPAGKEGGVFITSTFDQAGIEKKGLLLRKRRNQAKMPPQLRKSG